MLISMFMSILSIVVVVVIFIVAYHNLTEERRLSDLKTDFINNMTHELKTPLSTITVASKTLEFEKVINDRDKIIETARMIGKQSVSLNQLINLILEISIWERTEFEPEMKQMAVGTVLTDIVDSFRAGYREVATINSRISLEGLTIKADVTYFTTMINNLLLNAVRYSPENPMIDIKAYSNGREVIINITDNGIGIDKSHQKLIFEKFYRVSHGDIHKTKGLGLGLYYVSRIAASHGGRVELDSQPGKGSTFTVILPLNSN
jgi:two-component system phosphate regulon sensor histidine kinase PhoR